MVPRLRCRHLIHKIVEVNLGSRPFVPGGLRQHYLDQVRLQMLKAHVVNSMNFWLS